MTNTTTLPIPAIYPADEVQVGWVIDVNGYACAVSATRLSEDGQRVHLDVSGFLKSSGAPGKSSRWTIFSDEFVTVFEIA